MKSATFVSTLLAAAAPLASAGFGVGLDNDDVPSACKTICGPITRLSDACDVDLRSDVGKDEDHLQNQCICTNKSFDVANVAGLCGDCIHQNSKRSKRDDDGKEDINWLLKVCGFATKQYSPAATTAVNGVSVSAARLTDISQLTTTLGGPGDAPAATQSVSSSAGVITLTGSQTMASVTAGSQTAGSQTTSASSSTSSAAAAATAINFVYVGAAALVAGLC